MMNEQRRRLLRVTAIAAALAVILAPLSSREARAEPPAEGAAARDLAERHYQRGKALYVKGDYRGAIREFTAADRIAPAPMLEYNIALCHERLGEPREALRRYRAFLDRMPDAPNRAKVEKKIAELEGALRQQAAEAAEKAGLEPPPPEEEPAAAPPPVYVSTGDPELDRVARIDVEAIHAARAGPAVDGAAAAVPEGAAPAGDPRIAEEPRPAGPAAPPAEPGEKKSKPLYRQWWFWVIVGVSAIIVADIVISAADDGDSRRALMEAPGLGSSSSGAVILRF